MDLCPSMRKIMQNIFGAPKACSFIRQRSCWKGLQLYSTSSQRTVKGLLNDVHHWIDVMHERGQSLFGAFNELKKHLGDMQRQMQDLHKQSHSYQVPWFSFLLQWCHQDGSMVAISPISPINFQRGLLRQLIFAIFFRFLLKTEIKTLLQLGYSRNTGTKVWVMKKWRSLIFDYK